MARRCRDCPRCTEAVLFSLVFLPVRVVWALCTAWNVGLFRRRCPACGHWLSAHQKRGGRFVD